MFCAGARALRSGHSAAHVMCFCVKVFLIHCKMQSSHKCVTLGPKSVLTQEVGVVQEFVLSSICSRGEEEQAIL